MKKQKEIFKMLFFLIIFFIPNFTYAAMNSWVDHGNIKVRQQGDYTGTGQQAVQDIVLNVAKNEFEPFQIFTYANGEDLTGVNVTVSDLTDGTNTILSNNFDIYKEGYTFVADSLSNAVLNRKTRADYVAGYLPDILFPKVDRYYGEIRNAFPFSVTNGNVQGIWIDLNTTASTVAGTYTGTYTITADGKTPVTGNITLQVWNFVLPSTASQKNMFVIGDSTLEHGHFGTWYLQGANWTANMEALYIKAMLYDRITPSIKGGGFYFTTIAGDGSANFTSNFNVAYKSALDGTAISAGTYAGAKIPAIDIEGAASYKTYIRGNNIQASSLNTVTLDASASAVSGYYNQMYITTGSQTRHIIAYDEVSKIATLETDWTTLPTAGASYEIYNASNERDADATKHTQFLQSWWNYFTTNGWDPMHTLYAYLIDEPKGYDILYRGNIISDYKTIALKAEDMYNVNTGGQGHWRNSFTTVSRNTADAKRLSDLISPTAPYLSLDTTGFWCPVMTNYEYYTPQQGPANAALRSTYPDFGSWPNENHWSYFSNMNYAVPTGGYGQVDVTTDSPAFWTRAMGWIAWTYRTTGLLYYFANQSSEKAEPFVETYWRNNTIGAENLGVGGGTFYYPGIANKSLYTKPDNSGTIVRSLLPASTPEIGGVHDIPLDTMRSKLWRESQEDREYMEILRVAGKVSEVDGIVNTLYSATSNFLYAGHTMPTGVNPYSPYYSLVPDINNIFTARNSLANLILAQSADAVAPTAPSGLNVL